MSYDTRTRKSKLTNLRVQRSSSSNSDKYYIPVGGLYEKDETVYSWRGQQGEKKTFRYEKNGKTVRLRVSEPHNFILSVKTHAVAPGTLRWSTGSGWYQNSGDAIDAFLGRDDQIAFVNSFTFEFDQGLAFSAVNEAYAGLNEARIAGLTQLFELKESVEMLSDIAVEAIKMFTALKRSRTRDTLWKHLVAAGVTPWFSRKAGKGKRDVTQPISSVANLWLLLRYGFMPLYLSAMDIISSLSQPKDEPFVVEGSASIKPDDVITKREDQVSSTLFTSRLVKHVERTANCKLYAEYKRDENPFGFGAYDAILTAWEKIPLSFVVDWFVGVGDWLAAYRPGGAKVLYSYVTYKVDAWAQYEAVGAKSLAGSSSYSSYTSKPSKYRRSYVERRTPISPSTLPVMSGESLQWFRQLDAAALLWGVAGGILTDIIKKSPKGKH